MLAEVRSIGSMRRLTLVRDPGRGAWPLALHRANEDKSVVRCYSVRQNAGTTKPLAMRLPRQVANRLERWFPRDSTAGQQHAAPRPRQLATALHQPLR